MIVFADTAPNANVAEAEYIRLLGYPRGWVLDGRARELADGARAWYDQHGKPWVFARESTCVDVDADRVNVGGTTFTSRRLAHALRDADADRIVLVAASAGPELEREAQRLWADEKPDEYFFLEVYGSAVVEHLTMMAGARLCARADAEGRAVLPHYSPGYPHWDISEQASLLGAISGGDATAIPGAIEVMESGMLRPKKSLLAAFGTTRLTDRVRRLTDLVPCENCTLAGCAYRRAPYRGAQRRSEVESIQGAASGAAAAANGAPLQLDARYSVSVKALRRWAAERLSIRRNADGTVHARFRYEGSTCSNMGRTLRFDYDVTLGPEQERYPILEQHCAPSADDDGHTSMCRYRVTGPRLLDAIAAEQPLLGRPLDDVLAWSRPASAPSCYCDVGSGAHKWGLVLETLHFALAQQLGKVEAA